MGSCLACDLAAGRAPLPGGRIHETARWLVEHCVGPLGVGTLLIKPKRHVVHVWELTAEEAREFGPLLRWTAQIAAELTPCEQVYTTQWSHAGGVPGHLHWVIQPVTRDQTLMFGLGPGLQQAMFVEGSLPTVEVVDAIADRARLMFATSDELS